MLYVNVRGDETMPWEALADSGGNPRTFLCRKAIRQFLRNHCIGYVQWQAVTDKKDVAKQRRRIIY